MELQLTQKQADKLIKMAKELLKTYNIQLTEGCKGYITLTSVETKREFRLYYLYNTDDYHLNFHDVKTNLNLVRINLDHKFHKNADHKRIHNNRINIFCQDEFDKRADGGYMRAYPLPYDIISNSNNFIEVFNQLIKYINVTDANEYLCLTVQESLL